MNNLPEPPIRKKFDSSTDIDLSAEALRHRLERQDATPEEIEQLLSLTRPPNRIAREEKEPPA